MKKLLQLSALIMSLSFASATFGADSYKTTFETNQEEPKRYDEQDFSQDLEREDKLQLALKNRRKALKFIKKNSGLLDKLATVDFEEKKQLTNRKKEYLTAKSQLNTSTCKYILLGASTIATGFAWWYYNKPMPILAKGLFSLTTGAVEYYSYKQIINLAEDTNTKQHAFTYEDYQAGTRLLENTSNWIQNINRTNNSIATETMASNIGKFNFEDIAKQTKENGCPKEEPPKAPKKKAYLTASFFGFGVIAPWLPSLIKHLPFFAKS